MALRDQPYIPLYVQDIMTDEKLNECSAATHGIYIKGILCLMHKSDEYGKILLKQKFKQNESTCYNFAAQLVKHLPYTVDEIAAAIDELLTEKVCYLDGDYLCQKRMINDNQLSVKRAEAGRGGGTKTSQLFAKAKVQANTQANSEYENEYENVIIIEYLNSKVGSQFKISGKKTKTLIQARINEGFTVDDFKKVIDIKSAKWKDDLKMSQFLRPETLFGTKFESYLNEKIPTKKPLITL